MREKVCPICKIKFIPKSSRQTYCKNPVTKRCIVCGEEFTTVCSPDAAKTCSNSDCKKKAGQAALINAKRICKLCGREYKPTSTTQQFCNAEVLRKCEICGKEFTIRCTAEEFKRRTCSFDCQQKLASENRQSAYKKQIKVCEWCGKEFHPISNTQIYCNDIHYQTCKNCGAEFTIDVHKQDKPLTCSRACSIRYINRNGNPGATAEAIAKREATCIEKYGAAHPMQIQSIKEKVFATYKDRTGFDHPAHNPNTLKGKKLNVSSLELKLKNIFSNNRIDFEQQKLVSNGNIYHAFDFYLPKYKIYVDVDGAYYHGYLDDSNGLQISEDRDAVRSYLVNNSEMYFVVTEVNFKKDAEELLLKIKEIDSNLFNYNEYMFEWCRSIHFPYPEYQVDRLKRDYNSLIRYSVQNYSSHAKLAMSTIRHFHKSIFDARVGSSPSLVEAWNDDSLLKKVIENRMIYKDSVDPSKILSGFYISKIVPKVSVFNPVLAKYLTTKYLNKFDVVHDPFSGFSGRMLGVTAAGKKYVGSDLNARAVEESNKIIQFHNLDAKVCQRDVTTTLASPIRAQCVLTCPPYNAKEKYSNETIFKRCDDWIEFILAQYNAERYVFVVDNPGRYCQHVAEEIVTKSYFTDITEKVVVIER